MALLDRLLFEPDKNLYTRESDYTPPAVSSHLVTSQGVSLHLWIFKCSPSDRRGVVVQLHGNAENVTSHAPYVAWLASHGFDVLSWDYRGFGQSSGHPSKEGLVSDAKAILEEARRMADNLPIIVIGQSLGASIALNALKGMELPRSSQVVLEGAFASFRGLAKIKMKEKYHPALALLAPLLFSKSFDAEDAILNLQCPLLSLHSEDDEIIPISEHIRLFDACPRNDKTFWRIKGQKHLDAFRDDISPYRMKLVRYLRAGENAHL